MSNEAMNAHIEFGQPLGDDEGLVEIADWAGGKLLEAKKLLLAVKPHGCEDVNGKDWYAARAEFLSS